MWMNKDDKDIEDKVSKAERYCVQVLAKCPENCRASEGKHQLPGAKPCLLNLITSEIVIHEK